MGRERTGGEKKKLGMKEGKEKWREGRRKDEKERRDQEEWGMGGGKRKNERRCRKKTLHKGK